MQSRKYETVIIPGTNWRTSLSLAVDCALTTPQSTEKELMWTKFMQNHKYKQITKYLNVYHEDMSVLVREN